MSASYRTDWCKRCGIHRAMELEGFICPVCRDQNRRDNEAMYKFKDD